MTEQIITLEICWYISPPWGREIPILSVNLFERVYLKNSRTFGYCCGIQWHKDKWMYAIATDNEIISAWGCDFIGTGRLQTHTIPKPVFVLGERVMLRADSNSPKQRIVLGIEQLDDCWFYLVECISPQVNNPITRASYFTYVTQDDLVQVLA
ncbi:DUF1392 family protein [aff. Roholtiella sp. LEGE 12411]|uniref:DUF1392 family protein n=1 Tax=aff. Roholtiella sp. LEGE 12411 TaxID=1828822 RepID=UPI001880CB0A|nr:DUF1392 family protein [aff. Roholtiella sp. LEGE 12411]MBE9037207.1 DUF1392 family protein [aff. Roholtiella sp. LEGE 12411]